MSLESRTDALIMNIMTSKLLEEKSKREEMQSDKTLDKNVSALVAKSKDKKQSKSER